MKKITFIMMLACAMLLNFSFAQENCKPMPGQNAPHPENMQHPDEPKTHNPMMLKMKKDFIKENFVIESNKTEAFWNAYNEYESSIRDIHKTQREFRKANQIPVMMTADSLSKLSDDIILKYYENNFSTKDLIIKAEEKFFKDMKKILTPQQIAQYYILEKNFQTSAVKMKHPQPSKMNAQPMQMKEKPIQLEAHPMKKAFPSENQKKENH